MKQPTEDRFPVKYLSIFFVIALVIIVAGYLIYQDRKAAIEAELYQHVVAIKEIKLQQISKEQLQRERIINSFVQLPNIKKDIIEVIQDNKSKDNMSSIISWSNELKKDFDLVSVNIFNNNADLIFSTDSAKNIFQNFLKHEIKYLLQRDSSSLTNLYLGYDKNLIQSIITPIKKSGKTAGYFWTEISFFQYLFPILSYTKRESDDVEFILLKTKSDLGFLLKDINENSRYVLKVLPLSKKDKSEFDNLINLNYTSDKKSFSEKQIIASVNKIPGTDWYLIAKINQDKIAQSTKNTAVVVLIISLLLITLSAAITYAIWKRSRLYFITKTINLRKEKEALSERYTSLTRYANDMILSLNKEGKILEANQKAVDNYGYRKDELLKMNILDLSQDRKKDVEIIFSSINTQDGILFETNHKRKNGTILPVEISAKLINQGDEEIILAIIRDNTERKKLELDLILAKDKAEEMDRLKTVFLANMSHELNTPMSGIIGFSELLLLELEDKSHRDMASFIHKSSKRLNETLTSLLDLSKLESGNVNIKFSPVEVINILSACKVQYTESATLKGLVINTNFQKEKIFIKGDSAIFHKIFCNLIDNAIKYTLAGEVNLFADQIDGKSIIKISDTGIGISEDHLGLIFEPFRQVSEGLTRKYEGSGLGLSITKKYVEILGGKIKINSRINSGTTVILEFPPVNVEEKKIDNS